MASKKSAFCRKKEESVFFLVFLVDYLIEHSAQRKIDSKEEERGKQQKLGENVFQDGRMHTSCKIIKL